MSDDIEFVDGFSQTVIARTPRAEVPPPNREVYLKEGHVVSRPEQADQIVPITRVVSFELDAAGKPAATPEQIVRIVIQEYDAEGVMRRETTMVPPPGM